MSNMEQTRDNVRILSEAEANGLTPEELGIISKVADEYNNRIPYGCTACKYCMPCPVQLDIPRIIELRNDVNVYGAKEKVAFVYDNFLTPKPSACIACKKCEEICPQHLHISDIMSETAGMFE
jgi:predicted aldo/keto reductase-like oxidoreductase